MARLLKAYGFLLVLLWTWLGAFSLASIAGFELYECYRFATLIASTPAVARILQLT